MVIGSYLSIITLNISFSDQRQRLAEWILKKQYPYIMLPTRDPPQTKGHIQTESEDGKK